MIGSSKSRHWFQFKIIHLMILAVIVAVTVWYLMPGQPIDPDRAAEVPVVLRIKNDGIGEGSKYIWSDVEVLEVLKNEPKLKFAQRMSIASHSWGVGIPGGVSTVYLVPYNGELPTQYWKLNEQDGKTRFTGFTHVANAKNE